MKNKFLKGSVFFTILSVAIVGCKKENPASENSSLSGISEQKFTKQVSAENGTLVFENVAHMMSELNRLSKLSFEEKLAFENNLGFRSLATIDKLINDAEVAHQEEFFKGVDPNLSVQAYENMGLYYQHTALFNEYLNKGVIERFVNKKDNSVSFALTVKNGGFTNVLNEAGKVIVGDELLLFEGYQTKTYNKNTMELLNTTSMEVGNEKDDGDYNFTKGTTGGDAAAGGGYWKFDPDKGDKYRYYAKVVFTSKFGYAALFQTYYWEARAEKKSFGNWNTTNNYNPIWGISASWNYAYWIKYNGAGWGVERNDYTYPLPTSAGNATSPYSLSNLNTNYTVRYLHPNGSYSRNANAGFDFFDNVRVYNYSFVFKFSGGASGHDYVAQ